MGKESVIARQIDNPRDALLYIDFLARFGGDPQLMQSMSGVAKVIRELMRRVEDQALANERAEAAK